MAFIAAFIPFGILALSFSKKSAGIFFHDRKQQVQSQKLVPFSASVDASNPNHIQ